MLTRMRLQGFKSWSDTKNIDLRPITVFFGANSSGKTSLLQALLLLKQTADSSDRSLVLHFGSDKTPVNLGDFISVAHKHETDGTLEMQLDWETDKPFSITDPKRDNQTVVEDSRLSFRTRVGRKNEVQSATTFVEEMAYHVGNATFGMRQARKGRSEYRLFTEGADFTFKRAPGRPRPLHAPVKCYGFPDRARAYHQNAEFLADLALALEDRLNHVYYLGPLRNSPKRTYTWTGAEPADMGRAGESVVDAILSSGAQGAKIKRGKGVKSLPLAEYIAKWLKELKLIHEFRVDRVAEGDPFYKVKVRRFPKSPEVLITDVGFGVSQILPVLVLCFYVPESSTIILEQPEIHLHPAVQSGLADVLVDAYKKRKVQILLESHSEHLLYRLQRRIAEEKLTCQEIGLYFCKARSGNSTLTRLNVDLFGTIENWPSDFFGDEFAEIAATQLAILNRRKKQS